jgi:2-keto-4-pentenoate hydratase/2-oxohepta-3-ene-1,7-dioic acid hydratase in catechol pathway
MDYPVDDLLAFASSMLTLYPGDVFSTGTPAGVGPIQDGDTLVAEVERIGRLEVKVGTRPPSRTPWFRELAAP